MANSDSKIGVFKNVYRRAELPLLWIQISKLLFYFFAQTNFHVIKSFRPTEKNHHWKKKRLEFLNFGHCL